MQEMQVWSPGWEDSLEKEMATHSSILGWEIPRTEEPAELQSMGPQRVEVEQLIKQARNLHTASKRYSQVSKSV